MSEPLPDRLKGEMVEDIVRTLLSDAVYVQSNGVIEYVTCDGLTRPVMFEYFSSKADFAVNHTLASPRIISSGYRDALRSIFRSVYAGTRAQFLANQNASCPENPEPSCLRSTTFRERIAQQGGIVVPL